MVLYIKAAQNAGLDKPRSGWRLARVVTGGAGDPVFSASRSPHSLRQSPPQPDTHTSPSLCAHFQPTQYPSYHSPSLYLTSSGCFFGIDGEKRERYTTLKAARFSLGFISRGAALCTAERVFRYGRLLTRRLSGEVVVTGWAHPSEAAPYFARPSMRSGSIDRASPGVQLYDSVNFMHQEYQQLITRGHQPASWGALSPAQPITGLGEPAAGRTAGPDDLHLIPVFSFRWVAASLMWIINDKGNGRSWGCDHKVEGRGSALLYGHCRWGGR